MPRILEKKVFCVDKRKEEKTAKGLPVKSLAEIILPGRDTPNNAGSCVISLIYNALSTSED